MKKIILLSALLYSGYASAQLVNGGFEVWDSVFTTSDCTILNGNFGVLNPLAGMVNHWPYSSGYGVCQSTDSHDGNYALVLHNWYGYAQGWITYDDTLGYRPLYLQGYFKYHTGGPNGLSYGNMYVALTHYNGLSNDTVAAGIFQFDSTALYTPFQVEMNYTSAQSPDSIHIFIVNGIHPCLVNNVCHILYLDHLTLGNSPLGIGSANAHDDISEIYYDQSSGNLNVINKINAAAEFSFYNLTGEKIIGKSLKGNSNNAIEIPDLPAGIYFYELSSQGHLKTGKIIRN